MFCENKRCNTLVYLVWATYIVELTTVPGRRAMPALEIDRGFKCTYRTLLGLTLQSQTWEIRLSI